MEIAIVCAAYQNQRDRIHKTLANSSPSRSDEDVLDQAEEETEDGNRRGGLSGRL